MPTLPQSGNCAAREPRPNTPRSTRLSACPRSQVASGLVAAEAPKQRHVPCGRMGRACQRRQVVAAPHLQLLQVVEAAQQVAQLCVPHLQGHRRVSAPESAAAAGWRAGTLARWCVVEDTGLRELPDGLRHPEELQVWGAATPTAPKAVLHLPAAAEVQAAQLRAVLQGAHPPDLPAPGEGQPAQGAQPRQRLQTTQGGMGA